jgi:lipid-A-disaccharide synthase
LLDRVPAPLSDEEYDMLPPVIGLFPGSRPNVIVRHLPVLEAAAALIKRQIPEAECRLFGLPSNLFKSHLLNVEESDFSQRKRLAAVITPSGTVSLENALLGIPMIVMYKLSSFNYFLARMVVTIQYITMVNILAKKQIVPEFIQDDATPEKIAQAVISLLKDKTKRKEMRKQLLAFRTMLGTPGAAQRAARIILGM